MRKFERGIAMDVKASPKSFWKLTTTRAGIGNLNYEDEKNKAEHFNSTFYLYSLPKMITFLSLIII